MKTATKVWLIVAASLFLAGIIVFGVAMTMSNWNFEKMGNRYESKTYEDLGDFSNISINTSTADIVFITSGDGKCKVVCYDERKLQHSVEVKDGTLNIDLVDTRKWYDYISFFSFGHPMITVYLPKTEYGRLSIEEDTGDVGIPDDFRFESIDISASTGDIKNYASVSDNVKIETSTGHITVEGIAAKNIELSVSTGDIILTSTTCSGDIKIDVSTGRSTLSDVKCENFNSDGSTGDVFLSNVIVSNKLSIERSTGDVDFENSDAGELFIKTDTGDVKGTLLSAKIFDTDTDTGKISVPLSGQGGLCKIKTDTGDIKISIN